MYANIFLVDKNTNNLIDKIKEHNGRSGDIIENTDCSGYRTEGIFLYFKDSIEHSIVDLQFSHESYGHVGDQFSLGPEYPIGYWTYAFDRGKVINLTNKKDAVSKAYWHDYQENPEPLHIHNIGDDLHKSLYKINNGTISLEFTWGTFLFAEKKYKQILHSNFCFFYTKTNIEKPTATIEK